MTKVDPENEALEARLRAYRPVGPPERLREAVLGLTTGRRPVRLPGWLTLAALLLLAVALRWSARSDVAIVSERMPDVLLLATPSLGAGFDRRVARAPRESAGERRRRGFTRAPMDLRIMGVER